jgi:uridine kinase
VSQRVAMETTEDVAIGPALEAIRRRRRLVPATRSVLVGITGIDGAGKGHVAARIAGALRGHGLAVALINVDGWLNLPAVRFDPADPAEHFYRHALRLDEMFDRLVLPLRDRRSHRLTMDFAEETATAYRPHTYAFDGVDVVVLEGIYLLKRAYRDRYDVSVWVECSFETALRRAIARAQEGLPPEATIRAYETIYFPAQRIHFERDDPRAAASLVVPNDG